MTLFEELKCEESQMIETRRALHRIAELGMKEFKTTAYIKQALLDIGVEIYDLSLETGVCALLRGNNPGPTIALRADIDALPIQEETGLEFASEHPGVSHACGHDLHATVLLSTARYLTRHRDQLSGNVWLIFQPSEETLTGATSMLDAGCMRIDPVPEAILAYHTFPVLPTGTFGVIRGPANQSCDNIRITIKSPGGHGAYPHRCGDPVLAAAELLVQLQTAVSRCNNSMMPAVLTFGSIHGGTAPNIFPQSVVLEGTLRAVYQESRETICEAIQRISEHVCAAMRTEVEVEFLKPAVPSVVNDDKLMDLVDETITELFGREAAHYLKFPTAGSEDFAHYLQYCPGVLIRFGTETPDDPATALGLHTSKTHFDENSLVYATALFCRFAEKYLCGSL